MTGDGQVDGPVVLSGEGHVLPQERVSGSRGDTLGLTAVMSTQRTRFTLVGIDRITDL